MKSAWKLLLKQVIILISAFQINGSWAAEITIIVNIDKIKGNVMIGVFAEENASKFPSDDSGLEMIMFNGAKQEGITEKVTANLMEFKIELPNGTYAISAYQDLNSNGKMGRIPFIGVPTEPYGFSNNVRAKFGPPKFKAASFVVEGDTTIEFDII